MKKICCLIFTALIICIGLLAVPAAAQSQSLEVICRDGVTNLSGASFYLYRIGDYSENSVVPDEAFRKYRISWGIGNTEEMINLAMTLSGYILRDDPAADFEDITDEKGIADFDGEFIGDGVYLLLADKHKQDNMTYYFEPTVVVIPYGDVDYLTVTPKFTSVENNKEDDTVSYKVLKAWTEDDKSSRPSEIEIELLMDGEIYDTVTLNADNKWSHTWKDLSVYNHWTVVEKEVPYGYIAVLTQDGKTLLVKNTGTGEREEDTTKPNGKPELPETGSLQWPIPLLACVGIFLITLGYASYRKSEQADE